MENSNIGLSTKSRPSKGKLVINNGIMAQWMAHTREAATPRRSQLILIIEFMRKNATKRYFLKQHCKCIKNTF